MNRVGLIAAVAAKMDGTQAAADRAITAVTEAIGDAVASGDDVKIVGFGIFTPKRRAARQTKHPATGETIRIPEKATVKFRPGRDLLGRL